MQFFSWTGRLSGHWIGHIHFTCLKVLIAGKVLHIVLVYFITLQIPYTVKIPFSCHVRIQAIF